MIEGLTPLGPLERATGTRRPPPRTEAPPPVAPEHPLDPPPESPPAEVLEALDHAQRVLANLDLKHYSLRFSVDEGTSRIRVQVRDEQGNVVREIPPWHALAVLSGDRPFGLGIDARG